MHRDTFHSCPQCASGLDVEGSRMACGQCRGVLVPERELLDAVAGSQARALLAPDSKWNKRDRVRFVHDVGPAVSGASAFACPRCATAMTHHELFGVAIARCHAHGLWLDQAGERTILAAALADL